MAKENENEASNEMPDNFKIFIKKNMVDINPLDIQKPSAY